MTFSSLPPSFPPRFLQATVRMAVVAMLCFCCSSAIPTAHAQQAVPAATAAAARARMKQGQALEAAGQYQAAAEAYDKAAKAFEAAGQSEPQAAALEKSAAMFEKLAEQLAIQGNVKSGPAAPNASGPAIIQPAAAAPTPAPSAAAGADPLPLDKSAIVAKNAKGEPAVAAKSGSPIEGIKLSRHDTAISSPSIAVGPDGTIHVAFVERRAQSPYIVSVYHRSSADGGKTWSEAKNLSEVLVNYQVGNCQVAVDSANRVYVIWRTGVAENFSTDIDAHGTAHNNLVYRVLANGAWNGQAIFIPPQHKREDENRANASWFVSTDPAAKVHIVWNMPPHARHPEAFRGKLASFVVGNSMIMEADLNGTDPGTPHEVYCAKIAEDPGYRLPGSDQFDTIEGYVDAGAQVHLITHVTYAGVGRSEASQRIDLVENGKQTEALKLPNPSIWRYPPKLLFDAKGRQHIIAMYEAGETPSVRDYLVGADAEPTVIRASKEMKGKLIGFQAYQAPEGRMIVLIQMNDTGNQTDDELYLSTSEDGHWIAPVNVTNNTGRQSFALHETSAFHASHVATLSYWYPGPAAATYDRQGHLILAYISKEHSVVQSSALGWTLAGGSTVSPKLLFLRF